MRTDPITELEDELGSAATEALRKMVDPNDESLNHLFAILADWEHQLKYAGIDFEALPSFELSTDSEPRVEGPGL